MKTILIGSDHGGFLLKNYLLANFKSNEYILKDMGCFSEDSVDYPDIAHPLAEKIASGEYEKGVLICGSGNGIMMSANKHKNIRAALCWNKEIVELARLHNNANILVLPGRFIDFPLALDMFNIFLNTPFEGGRHQSRIDKINV